MTDGKKKSRVLVGMSGGVDSSVAAYLLKKQGYDVIGITMQLLEKETEKQSRCCNIDSISDAKRVANMLGIPHYVLNIRNDFKQHVIDYFVDEYLNGNTPNPCVECNRHIKFDVLLQKAKELEADFVATGHYVQRVESADSKEVFLKKGVDHSKDQSYFLYMLTFSQLKNTLFPLGGYTKAEIRTIANNANLITANKPESQEICFVSQGNYRDFIEKQLAGKFIEKGPIIDINGKKLGEHNGLFRYTIGQRKGLHLGTPNPMYVLKIDSHNNQLVVGPKEALPTSVFKVEQFSLVNPSENIEGMWFDVKTRYQMTSFKGKVNSYNATRLSVTVRVPQSQITAGQSAVFYHDNRVIGGGIIALE